MNSCVCLSGCVSDAMRQRGHLGTLMLLRLSLMKMGKNKQYTEIKNNTKQRGKLNERIDDR